MAGETMITVVGNLTGDPELRYTPNGHAVANFSIASTPRVFDRQSNQWQDGEPLFLRASVWRDHAENVAGTLQKGMRVIAQGDLRQRQYEKDGQKRSSYELDIHEIGPALKYASATVARNAKSGQQPPQQGQQGGGWAQQPPQQGQQGAPATNQGWAAPGQGGGWAAPENGSYGGQQQPPQNSGGFDDEPPF